ncbi:hypothetical protein, partial [Streptomyces carpaticus]
MSPPPVAARRLAEPSDADRLRRGPRGASGAAGPSPRWLAEPSDADRVRRGPRGASGAAGPSPRWLAEPPVG